MQTYSRPWVRWSCVVGLGLISMSTATLANAEGSCRFKKFSPHLDRWFAMCQMPASPEICDKLAMTRGTSDVKFVAEACSAPLVTGGCVVNGANVYFREGSKDVATKGCSALGGTWQPEMKPAS